METNSGAEMPECSSMLPDETYFTPFHNPPSVAPSEADSTLSLRQRLLQAVIEIMALQTFLMGDVLKEQKAGLSCWSTGGSGPTRFRWKRAVDFVDFRLEDLVPRITPDALARLQPHTLQKLWIAHQS